MKVFVLSLFFSSSVLATGVEVYLNGVRITGARDQVIENARVELDKAGNVHINAPEYKVRELGTSESSSAVTPPPAARLSKKYYVVTEVSRTKSTGYEIQVMVNNRYLTTLNDDVPQFVLELTDKLVVGENSVSFRALPKSQQSPSGQNTDTFNVVLGEGHGEEGGTLTIDKVIGEFRVSSSEGGEKAQTFTFSAR